MRPSEDVLASFYDLADLDENKRFNAIISILDAVCFRLINSVKVFFFPANCILFINI